MTEIMKRGTLTWYDYISIAGAVALGITLAGLIDNLALWTIYWWRN